MVRSQNSARLNAILLAIVATAAIVFLWNANRPVDTASWREADIAAIARNYHREGMQLLYPQIDWRGAGPGYVESEFPFLSYLMATAYGIGGVDERVGRYFSAIAVTLASIAFVRLARDRLTGQGTVAATLLFVLNPLVFSYATALQPEPWLLLGYVSSILFFTRWLDGGGRIAFWLAATFTCFTILAKANGLVLGLIFLPLVLSQRGIGGLRDYRLWVFGILVLIPPAMWYAHAHQFWVLYGNSLGLSNEYHWIGWDLVAQPKFFLGILRSEVWYVWLPTGLALVLVGILGGLRPMRLETAWLVALAIYYLVTARTTADPWAHYYHILTVPLAALLGGRSLELLLGHNKGNIVLLPSAVALVLAAAGYLAFKKFSSDSMIWTGAAAVVAACGWIAVYLVRAGAEQSDTSRFVMSRTGALLASAGAILFALTLFDAGRRHVAALVLREPHPFFECAKVFERRIPKGAKVLASGGVCYDGTGRLVAYNKSYMFHWMDRQGMNLCVEQQSVGAVKDAIAHGAEYFVAEVRALGKKEGFEATLRAWLPVVADCPDMILFDLRQ